MSKIMFLVDTLADLPASLVNSRTDIKVIDVPILVIDENSHVETFHWRTADNFSEIDEMVRRKGCRTKTSLPTIYETPDEEEYEVLSVERATKEALKQGCDVIYLAVNSEISGSYSAISALYESMEEEGITDGHRIACVDTKCASTGLAMLLSDLLKVYDNELISHDVDAIVTYLDRAKASIAMLFTWLDFRYIKNSGKVRGLPAFAGKVLGFHPLGSVEFAGPLYRPLTTLGTPVHGKKRFMNVLARFIEQTIISPDGVITIAHGDCLEQLMPFIEFLQDYFPEAHIKYGIDYRCGAAIQAHGGPTSIHINYHRNRPNDLSQSKSLYKSLF